MGGQIDMRADAAATAGIAGAAAGRRLVTLGGSRRPVSAQVWSRQLKR